MHDWTFVTAAVDWKEGTARLEFVSSDGLKVVKARGVTDLRLPRKLPWGPSISVNRCDGPTKQEDGGHSLTIEMQSGDTIELLAAVFEMPPS